MEKRKPAEDVRDWTETYYDVQGTRKAVANQIRSRIEQAYKAGTITKKEYKDAKQYLQSLSSELREVVLTIANPRSIRLFEDLVKMEKFISNSIKEEVSGIPIYEKFLKDIPGMGHTLSAALTSWLDPRGTEDKPAKHASSFWKFAGYHVVDGIAPKRRKGEKLDWNPRVRALCWNIGESFIKKGNVYRDIYDVTKTKYESQYSILMNLSKLVAIKCPFCKSKEKMPFLKADGKRSFLDYYCPKCDKGFLTGKHLHNMAKRKMVKRFLLDLWIAWRTLEGLPITEPYVVAQLGHTKKPPPKKSPPKKPKKPK